MSQKKQQRSLAIDLLRVIAILYVVWFWHLFSYTNGFPQKNFVTYRLTDIFLGSLTLISGYLVGLKNQFKSKNEIISYYKKKIVRIYPLYLLALTCFWILKIRFNREIFVKAVFLLSMFNKPAPMTLWFITMIFIFYLISPLLISMRASWKKYVFTSTTILVGLIIYSYFLNILDLRIIMYFPAFSIGVLMAKKKELFFNTKLYYLWLIFGISWTISFINFDSKLILTILRIPMVMIGSLLSLRICMKLEKYISHSNIIEVLSYASFCMYMFHRPLFQIFKDIYFPGNYFNQVIYLMFICVPVIIIISWLLQRSYDKLIDWLTRRST